MNHNTNRSIYDERIMKELIGVIVTVIIGVILFMEVVRSYSGSDKGTDSISKIDIQNIEKTSGMGSVDYNLENNQMVFTDGEYIEERGSVLEKDIAPSVLNIGVPEGKSGNADSVEFLRYNGTIYSIGQEDSYSFVAPFDGVYRVDLTGMIYGTSVNLYLYDELGYTIRTNTYCINDTGLTGFELKAGKTYYVKVKQDEGTPSYQLSIGMQKATVDLTGFTEYNDSIEYIDQCNRYTFSAPCDGLYRFDMTGIKNETDFNFYVIDSLGKPIKTDTYCYNGHGITVNDLKQGEQYEIQVVQDDGFSSYTLSIGYQMNTVDIDGYSSVRDSVYYTDQRNVYSLNIAKRGGTGIRISGLAADTWVEIYVLNDLGETVVSDTYFTNGDSVMINDADVGDHYEIQIYQDSGMSEYELIIE